jgi:hypothetical protein
MDELRFDGEGGIVICTGRAGIFVAAGHGSSVIVNAFGSLRGGDGAFNVPPPTVVSEPGAGVSPVVASMLTTRQQSAKVIVDLSLTKLGGRAAWSTTRASPATGLSPRLAACCATSTRRSPGRIFQVFARLQVSVPPDTVGARDGLLARPRPREKRHAGIGAPEVTRGGNQKVIPCLRMH